MRIRILAAAMVTAGALVTVMTGAASADTSTTPVPPAVPAEEADFVIVCEGGEGHVVVARHRLADDEVREIKLRAKKFRDKGEVVIAKRAEDFEVTRAVPVKAGKHGVVARSAKPGKPFPAKPAKPAKPLPDDLVVACGEVEPVEKIEIKKIKE
ncbi:hypothetical protein ACFFMN_16355 [Planobispora siamensis]|uniref:Uncharacterized protein n=1 Tax=Planobispora siamensis TaxID=936338 RepID=A0A8J3SIY0_9ACTN|nr:hypothetical protein [Planobispora siamensis]GIH93807.1 hypothetical protein Psi01_44370 [Planobispora siamensis]